MKGDVILINGENWMVVDVAPAEPLADMVAVILEEESFNVMVRGAMQMTDIMTHLGAVSNETTLVLVPEAEGQAALALIAETVTDYEGDELEAYLQTLNVDDPDTPS